LQSADRQLGGRGDRNRDTGLGHNLPFPSRPRLLKGLKNQPSGSFRLNPCSLGRLQGARDDNPVPARALRVKKRRIGHLHQPIGPAMLRSTRDTRRDRYRPKIKAIITQTQVGDARAQLDASSIVVADANVSATVAP
jgi:hypothetical protein